LRQVEFAFEKLDQRPPLVVFDVDGLCLDNFHAEKAEGVETMRLEQVKDLSIRDCPGLADQRVATIEKAKK
jgi:hypothetical protein